MKLAGLIVKNAIRNPRRSVLTILSITISIFLVSSLQAILTRLDNLGQSSGAGHLRLVVRHRTSLGQPLPVAYKQRIAGLPGVKAVGAWNWFGGIYKDPANFFANFAVDADELEKTHQEYRVPPDQLEAFKRERTAAMVGKALMDKYDWKLGDRVTLKGTIYPFDPECTIRAVFTTDDPSQERVFFFHWDYFNEALNRRNQVGTFAVLANTPEDVPRLMDAIDRTFRNTDAETKTETEQAFNLSFVSMLGNVKLLLNAISAAVVFTILLVAGNTMAMSIRERTGEVAVLKTLGFRRNTILYLLVGESLAIALLGGLLGGLGAKTTYAFIGLTSTKGQIFLTVYAFGVALLAGYGTWILFAGSHAARGLLRIVRYVVSVVGATAGFGAGAGFYYAAGLIMTSGGFFSDFRVTYGTVLLGLVIAATVGIFSATFPALRATRTGISDALRYVG
ncbi:MAG: ABC transporter permease [Terriglobia bacterium]